MELSDFYPKAGDLIKSELDVLDHLRTDPYIKLKHSDFARHANAYFQRNQNSRSSGFEFVSYFDVFHAAMHRTQGVNRKQAKPNSDPNTRLLLAVRIELEKQVFRNVTYCLTVCRIRSRRHTILRKFHFDVTVDGEKSGNRIQHHPICHLQYCGEMVPKMAEMGCSSAQLDQMSPWLSEPRIFFWPMSLALLIDMALREFPDEHSKKFRSSNEWRGIVRKQEKLILQPFYQKCVDVIHDTKGNSRTLADEFYIA